MFNRSFQIWILIKWKGFIMAFRLQRKTLLVFFYCNFYCIIIFLEVTLNFLTISSWNLTGFLKDRCLLWMSLYTLFHILVFLFIFELFPFNIYFRICFCTHISSKNRQSRRLKIKKKKKNSHYCKYAFLFMIWPEIVFLEARLEWKSWCKFLWNWIFDLKYYVRL